LEKKREKFHLLLKHLRKRDSLFPIRGSRRDGGENPFRLETNRPWDFPDVREGEGIGHISVTRRGVRKKTERGETLSRRWSQLMTLENLGK